MATIAELAANPPDIVFERYNPPLDAKITLVHRTDIRGNVHVELQGMPAPTCELDKHYLPTRRINEINAYCKMVELSCRHYMKEKVRAWVIQHSNPANNRLILIKQMEDCPENIAVIVMRGESIITAGTCNLLSETHDDLNCGWDRQDGGLRQWVKHAIVAQYRMEQNYDNGLKCWSCETGLMTRSSLGNMVCKHASYERAMNNVGFGYCDAFASIEFEMSRRAKYFISNWLQGEICGFICMHPKNDKLNPVTYMRVTAPADLTAKDHAWIEGAWKQAYDLHEANES